MEDLFVVLIVTEQSRSYLFYHVTFTMKLVGK